MSSRVRGTTSYSRRLLISRRSTETRLRVLVAALDRLDERGAGIECLEVRRLLLGHAGQDFGFGSLEEIDDERRKSTGGHRQVEIELGRPPRGDAFEQRAPAGQRLAPAAGKLLVGQAGGPQLPEDAHVAGPEVLAKVRAGGAPLRRERLGPGVES